MRKIYEGVVKHRKFIIILFLAVTVICALLKNLVGVNYDMNDYLPKDSPSTVAIEMMEAEFDGGIPNARVMVKDVTTVKRLSINRESKALTVLRP